jgi:hypothetical protein
VACSEDGRYIFLGHPHGLSVMAQPQGITTSSSSSPYCVPVWQEDQVEITSLQITCLGEMVYLLASLDDMGNTTHLNRTLLYHMTMGNTTELHYYII